jgi:hypothetical protein
MNTTKLCLVAGLALALPGAAIAQTKPDLASVEYCTQLASKYSAQRHPFEAMTAAEAVAVAKCKTNPDDSIATLEQAMTNAKIDLPLRDRAAIASEKQ